MGVRRTLQTGYAYTDVDKLDLITERKRLLYVSDSIKAFRLNLFRLGRLGRGSLINICCESFINFRRAVMKYPINFYYRYMLRTCTDNHIIRPSANNSFFNFGMCVIFFFYFYSDAFICHFAACNS